MLYIKNVNILTPFKILKNAGILIRDEKIKKIFLSKSPSSSLAARVIDAKGKIACPGFIDVHLQGAGGCDFLDATPEAVERISKTLARFGATSYLATTVFKNGENRHIENLIKYQGVELLGIHLEGPFINPKKKGMIKTNGITSCSDKYFNKVMGTCAGKLKMMTIAPELKGAVSVIKRLKKAKVVASFGHSYADYEETQKGIIAGIDHATHVFNAMRSIHHRDPGPLPALLTDEKVSVQLISDGVHIHPAVIKLIVKLKGIKNIVLITDSMSSMGLPDGKYVYDSLDYESKGGACRYKDGTLIGTALPLNQMLKRFMLFGGVSLPEALQTVTVNPARVLGIGTKKGSIEEGKDADLVIMDKDLNVEKTIIGGQVVYSKQG